MKLHTPNIIRARTRDTAFLYRMPAGIPGDVNRMFACTVEPDIIDPSNPPVLYGNAVALDGTSGKIRPIGAGDAAADLYGVLARPYPTNVQTAANFFGTQTLGSGNTPPISGMCDVLKMGYIMTKLYGATASKAGGAVYVRIAGAGAGQIVGGFEAAADGGNTIQAGAKNTYYFRGAADASGNVEIAWNN